MICFTRVIICGFIADTRVLLAEFNYMRFIDSPASMFFASLTISALVFRWKLIFELTIVGALVVFVALVVFWLLACFPNNGAILGGGWRLLVLLLLGMFEYYLAVMSEDEIIMGEKGVVGD